MNNKEEPLSANRNYSSISPSARALLLLKGFTDIPFALEAAKLISRPDHYQPDFSIKDLAFWARLLHFESRYKSINQLLSGLPIQNILEISSGFSFRGLSSVLNKEIYYIDTDLPEIITAKLNLLNDLLPHDAILHGELETLALNALDEIAFTVTAGHFPKGEVVIINEGLLVYLDMDEKRKLCSNIREVLRQRGGYWITADIYVKSPNRFPELKMNDKLQEFFREHRVEENKFNSFEEAEAFFKAEGFVIDKEAEAEHQNSGSLKHLWANATQEQLDNLRRGGRIRATWRLKLVD
jgi:O-methyltransferase involved in polyketide biosynthesis